MQKEEQFALLILCREANKDNAAFNPFKGLYEVHVSLPFGASEPRACELAKFHPQFCWASSKSVNERLGRNRAVGRV